MKQAIRYVGGKDLFGSWDYQKYKFSIILDQFDHA
jgi:hypothetical protein